MKQKYLISKGDDGKTLSLKEFAEVERGDYGMLCDVVYDMDTIASAASGGVDRLISLLRTQDFYPRGLYARIMAESIIDLIGSPDRKSVELAIDDKESLAQERLDLEALELEVVDDEDSDDAPDALDEVLDGIEDDEEDSDDTAE
jgi:hypothetical protein